MSEFVDFHASQETAILERLGVDRRLFKPTENSNADTYVSINRPELRQLVVGAIEAVLYSAGGKGQARHGQGVNFLDQPIMAIARKQGTLGLGGLNFQAEKKQGEALGMFLRGEHEAAIAEVAGSVVYSIALMMLMKELSYGKVPQNIPTVVAASAESLSGEVSKIPTSRIAPDNSIPSQLNSK